jgi:hypothetical protein
MHEYPSRRRAIRAAAAERHLICKSGPRRHGLETRVADNVSALGGDGQRMTSSKSHTQIISD